MSPKTPLVYKVTDSHMVHIVNIGYRCSFPPIFNTGRVVTHDAMAPRKADTHVRVTEETWSDLNQRKKPGDSFDDVIQRLLAAADSADADTGGEPADSSRATTDTTSRTRSSSSTQSDGGEDNTGETSQSDEADPSGGHLAARPAAQS